MISWSWTSGTALLWSSDSLNYTLDVVFANLGSHSCDCGTTEVNETQWIPMEFELFPNPSAGEMAWLRSDKAVQEVTVYSLAGRPHKPTAVERPEGRSVAHEGFTLLESTWWK